MPWDREAEFRLPIAVWREVMDQHFPDSAWLRVRRDRFDALVAYKARAGHLTWDHAIDALLEGAEGP
jgi:hypothetical protein